MNASPDQALVQAIAAELGVDPSFVEKDWHAMRLVAVLDDVRHGDLRPVLSGGTSLSKAYALIRRFSEDLDFKLILPEAGISRAARKEYRGLVIDAIRAAGDWSIEDADILVRNESRFFSYLIGYPASFAVVPTLRPRSGLKLPSHHPRSQPRNGRCSPSSPRLEMTIPKCERSLALRPRRLLPTS